MGNGMDLHLYFMDELKSALIPVKIPGTKRVNHKRAVKMYERAAGDKTLPSDLRPPIVLKVCHSPNPIACHFSKCFRRKL